LGEAGRTYVEKAFNRNVIAEKFFKEIIKYVS